MLNPLNESRPSSQARSERAEHDRLLALDGRSGAGFGDEPPFSGHPGEPQALDGLTIDWDGDRNLRGVAYPEGLNMAFTRDQGRVRGVVADGNSSNVSSFVTSFVFGDEVTPPKGKATVVSANRDGVETGYNWNGPVWMGESTTFASGMDLSATTLAATINNNFETTTLNVQTSAASHMAAYSYDRDGLVTCVGVGSSCASSTGSQSVIDMNGLLRRVISGTLAQEFSASGFGELTLTKLYSGRSYNSNGSVTQVGTELFALDYAATPRDKAGRIQEIVRSQAGSELARVAYKYDELGRLWQETTPTESHAFVYDSRGNRLCTTIDAEPRSTPPTLSDCSGVWIYDNRDRLRQAGDTYYSYTPRGTLFEKLSDAGDQTDYTYDLAGNLTRVRIDPAAGPTKTIDYIIDASGRRVGKKTNGAFSKQYVWSSALRVEAELDSAGAIKSRFIYSRSPNSPELIVRKAAGQPDRIYRVITDQLGSPVYVVNIASPSDVWLDASYDAWGNITSFKLDGVDQGTDTSAWPIPHGFAGGLFDSDTGLVRFGARDYDPTIGRWTARDPILFEGGQGNLYVYVNGDPVQITDPNGHVAPLLILGAAALLSGTAGYLGSDGNVAVALTSATAGLLGGVALVAGSGALLLGTIGTVATATVVTGGFKNLNALFGVGGSLAGGAFCGAVTGPAGFFACPFAAEAAGKAAESALGDQECE